VLTTLARVGISLVRLRTQDGVWLGGLSVDARRRTGTAVVWLHGLGSVFSSGQPLIREMSTRLGRQGIGYFKFNTRGHDVVAQDGWRLLGAAFERFGDSVRDIRAMIAFARKSGYTNIVLVGHSTGANKALHYVARTGDRRVTGLILLGPVSDIAGEIKRIGRRALRRRVAVAERIAKRDPEALVPRAFGFWSARRYLSLYRPGGAEDVFPYYRPDARWSALSRVRIPIAAIIGSRDEYLDRRPQELIEAFREHAVRARSFTGIILRGARHGFQSHEGTLAGTIVRWIRRRVP
jgi:pimeloyl-ACP methyl ester carboxylesterase